MNRHLKIAFFVAPLLAIGSYALTGYLMPINNPSASHGQLSLAGSCQPTENACLLLADEVELKLISNVKQGQQQLAIISTQPIEQLTLALGDGEHFKQFPMMKSDNNKYWQIKLAQADNINQYQHMRLAFSMGQKGYYAESEVVF